MARYLKRAYPGTRIVSFSTSPSTRWLRSRYTDEHHVIAANGPADHIDAVARLIERVRPHLFRPVNSNEMDQLLRGDLARPLRFLRNIDSNAADVPFLADPLGWLSMLAKSR